MSGRIARLAWARLRYSTVFDSACSVYRNGVLVPGYTDIPCVVGVPSDTSQNVDGQNIPVGAYLIGMPIGYEIRVGDYVHERGRQLRIIAVTDPRSYRVRTQGYAIDVGPVEEPEP